jgi:hypothetical protein
VKKLKELKKFKIKIFKIIPQFISDRQKLSFIKIANCIYDQNDRKDGTKIELKNKLRIF